MSYKEKIKKIEKEIAAIDKTLTILFAAGIIELILTILGYNRFDFLSLGIVLACAILFSRYVRKRNIKDIVLRTYDAMELTEEEYQTKYENKSKIKSMNNLKKEQTKKKIWGNLKKEKFYNIQLIIFSLVGVSSIIETILGIIPLSTQLFLLPMYYYMGMLLYKKFNLRK
jgi:galactokinase